MAKAKTKPENIDAILKQWPYDPNSISVRMVRGSDRRDVLQMRIEMGLLQLEVIGRPDGNRPFEADSVLDYLNEIRLHDDQDYVMSETECAEADREFVQYYHRRICWLALREFERAVDDADHTLELMDRCKDYSPDNQWTLTHEQYRPFVLFHRTQAASLAALDDGGAESAIESVNEGLSHLRELLDVGGHTDSADDDELLQRLTELRESLRQQFDVGRTLREQLSDAVAAEQYELAAQIRDQLARRDDIAPRSGLSRR